MDALSNQKGNRLLKTYESVAEGCIECGLCQKDCLFLQRYGSPKQIAEQRSLEPDVLKTSFECSLCWLCTAVCPKDIDPAAMFLEMRRTAHRAGHGSFPRHGTLLRYERWGTSPLITLYSMPEGCDTVFFPGCAMAGSRSERVLEIYEHLQRSIPALGIVLDCCTKPSHDLGRNEFFHSMFGVLRETLVQNGVQQVLVACPSCYRVWKDYGSPVSVTSMYEILSELPPLQRVRSGRAIAVHDPCSTRNETKIHSAVRKLLLSMGFTLQEMKHHGRKTLCCGEGGAACYIVPGFAENWTATRCREADGTYMTTYCAGCTHFLGRQSSIGHIADLIFDPEATLQGKESVARSPFTWLKRIMLKRKLQKRGRKAIQGTRSSDGSIQFSD